MNVAGATYIAVVVLLIWQAYRGQSVLRPDALTFGAVALLAGIALAGVAVVIRPNSAS
jgi:hypothetical protein